MLGLEDVDQVVTDEVIADYWQRGYWAGPKLFSDAEVQRLREALTTYLEGGATCES